MRQDLVQRRRRGRQRGVLAPAEADPDVHRGPVPAHVLRLRRTRLPPLRVEVRQP
ncbi:hypothetical protein ACU686_10880 [Yinghuangia aomiensis]